MKSMNIILFNLIILASSLFVFNLINIVTGQENITEPADMSYLRNESMVNLGESAPAYQSSISLLQSTSTTYGVSSQSSQASQQNDATQAYQAYPSQQATATQSNYATQTATWDKTFGGFGCDNPGSILMENDGYTIIGRAGTESGLWVIKLDLNGNKISDKIFSGSDSEFNDIIIFPHKIVEGGYLILGRVGDHQTGDVKLKKVDFEGNKIWEKIFGGNGPDSLSSNEGSVQQTKDGGYIFVGSTTSHGMGDSDVLLTKTDSNGNKIWDRTFGGAEGDLGILVHETQEEGYVILGATSSYGEGQMDIWLIRTDSNGNKIWDKTFGKENGDVVRSCEPTSDGGYIILAEMNSYGGDNSDLWLIKTDSNGNKIWDRTFGDKRSEQAGSVQQTRDGGYILVGSTESCGKGDHQDIWLIRTDSNGNKIWDRTFGGDVPSEGVSAHQTLDDGYIVLGQTRIDGCACGDIRIIKTDKDGFVKAIGSQQSQMPQQGTESQPSDKKMPPPPPHK